MLDSTVLGGTFTPSLSLGAGVVRNFFLQDRTQREDLFALPPSSKFLNPPSGELPLFGLSPVWAEPCWAHPYHCLGLLGLLHLAR